MTTRDAHDPKKDFSITQPASAPPGNATTENKKDDTDVLGEASGGFLGAVGGMSLGIAGGPVGLVIGGIAGAVGGWWAGHEIAKALTNDDEAAFKTHYETSHTHLADRRYEDVRPAYVAGHLAGRNPDYTGRTFDEIEVDLRRGWNDETSKKFGEWPAVRGYARTAYERARAEKAASR
jgi:hypothetical protein